MECEDLEVRLFLGDVVGVDVTTFKPAAGSHEYGHFLSLVKIAGSPQYLLTVTATEAAALDRSRTVTGRRPAVSWPRRAAAGTGRKLLRLEAARGPGCHVQATGYAG